MKKIHLIAAAFALAPGFAFAAPTDICTGASGTSGEIANATDGSTFVINAGVTTKCSSNVLMQYDQNGTTFWVGSASSKGKKAFKGSSAGGSVSPMADNCPDSGCTATEVGAALAEIAPTS